MKLLEEKIRQDGNAVNEYILKVDSFINHQVDPALMQEMGKESAHGNPEKAALQNPKPRPVPNCCYFFYERNQL